MVADFLFFVLFSFLLFLFLVLVFCFLLVSFCFVSFISVSPGHGAGEGGRRVEGAGDSVSPHLGETHLSPFLGLQAADDRSARSDPQNVPIPHVPMTQKVTAGSLETTCGALPSLAPGSARFSELRATLLDKRLLLQIISFLALFQPPICA